MQIVVEIPDDLLKKCGGYKDIRIHAETGKVEHITTDTNKNPYFTELRFIELPEHRGRLLILDERIVERNLVSLNTTTSFCNKWLSEVGISNSVVKIIPATKERQTERKCESCKYHDGRGGCLDSCALCRYTPKQTATKEGDGE